MFKNIDWANIRKLIVEQLKGAAVKAALKKIIGTATGTGFYAWIVKYILENFAEMAEPFVLGFLIKAGYKYEKYNGKIIVRRIEDARTIEDYIAASNDVFERRS